MLKKQKTDYLTLPSCILHKRSFIQMRKSILLILLTTCSASLLAQGNNYFNSNKKQKDSVKTFYSTKDPLLVSGLKMRLSHGLIEKMQLDADSVKQAPKKEEEVLTPNANTQRTN